MSALKRGNRMRTNVTLILRLALALALALLSGACGQGSEESGAAGSSSANVALPFCKQVGAFLDAGDAARGEAMRALKTRRGPEETKRTLQPLIADFDRQLADLDKGATGEIRSALDATDGKSYEAAVAQLEQSNWDPRRINEGDPLNISNAFARVGGWHDANCARTAQQARGDARTAQELFSAQRDPEEVQQRQAVVGGVLFLVALVASTLLAMYLHHGRLALHPADPFRLLLGDHDIPLRHTKGLSADVSRVATTNVSGGGGYVSTTADGNVHGSIAPVVSVTTVHEQFFIETHDGGARAIQLRDWNFPVGTGHLVSAVEFPGGGGRARALLVRNHTIDSGLIDSEHLRDHLGYRAWRTRLLELLGIVGITVAGAVIGSVLELDTASEVVGQAGAFGMLGALSGALIGTLIGSIVWIVAIRSRILRRFRGQDEIRLWNAINAAPITGAPATNTAQETAPPTR